MGLQHYCFADSLSQRSPSFNSKTAFFCLVANSTAKLTSELQFARLHVSLEADMETEGCHSHADGATLEVGAGCRSCSPAEQKEQQHSDVATEVTIHATPAEQSVSSLICSGLQTIHGGRPTDDAWEENYGVEQRGTSCSTYEYDDDVLPMQQDHVASQVQLEPYPPGPLPVVSHKPFTFDQCRSLGLCI